MTITFDHDDAFGMTDLEAYNYVPGDSHVIGNIVAADIAMNRYGSSIIFKGNEYDQWSEFFDAYYNDMNERGVNFS